MRVWKPMICLAVAFLIFTATVAEPTMHPGQRRGGRGGPAALDEAAILEDFDRIVELIWTDEEDDAWGDLRSDEQRQAFIDAFWAKRDPTPDTPDNEFRDIYMGRVTATMRLFGNEGTAGYRTDRGKVFITYGGNALLAQERRQGGGEMNVSTREPGEAIGGGRAPAQAFMYVWTMDASINPFLEDKEEIVFSPFQGTFPMSTRGVELSEEAFLANRDVQEFFAARRANPTAAMSGAGTGSAVDVPPEAEAMRGLMEEGVERSDLALQQDFRFFPAPEGNTYTVIAFEVSKAGLTFGPDNVKAFGLVLRDDPDQGEIPVHQIDANFTVSEDEGADGDSATHTFSVTLSPGSHRLAWGVMDTASRRITTVSEPFEVPDFVTQEMMLTSVAMASSAMQQTQEPIDLEKVYDLMRLGPFEIDIDVDRVFDRDGTISLLYFVMGTGVDQSTGQARIEVTHRVLLAADDQSIAVLPKEVLASAAISQNIPLSEISQLEAGTDYKLQIHVKDLVTGNELTHEVPFSVAPGGS